MLKTLQAWQLFQVKGVLGTFCQLWPFSSFKWLFLLDYTFSWGGNYLNCYVGSYLKGRLASLMILAHSGLFFGAKLLFFSDFWFNTSSFTDGNKFSKKHMRHQYYPYHPLSHLVVCVDMFPAMVFNHHWSQALCLTHVSPLAPVRDGLTRLHVIVEGQNLRGRFLLPKILPWFDWLICWYCSYDH